MVDIPSCQALVVDDDSTILALISRLLTENAISVLTATSAEDAIELYSRTAVDVVITDVQMSGMSGFDLLKRIKLVNPSAKVIVMTGNDSYESVLTSLQLGAYDYIQKPFTNHPAIVAAIQRAYESAKLQQENTELLIQLKQSHDQLTVANRSLVEANRKFKRLAVTDSLTGLFNRRYFDQALKREIGRQNRYQLALSVVMLDIDNFKSYNDNYGHDGGDEALKMVARALTDSARTSDIIARYGGEEFIVALPMTSPEKSIIFAERARKKIESTEIQLSNGSTTHLNVSIGICGVEKNHDPVTGEEIITTADKALYSAKKEGKNRYHVKKIDNNSKAA